MTKGLEHLLNIQPMEDMLREQGVFPDAAAQDADGAAAHPGDQPPHGQPSHGQDRLDLVQGKDHAEAMDTVYKESLKGARDLMDLGFNIDIPRARGIFEVASTLYGRAIEAKTSKRDAELKAMKLALEQRKLDILENKIKGEMAVQPTTLAGDATLIKEDRNELIKRLREQIGTKSG